MQFEQIKLFLYCFTKNFVYFLNILFYSHFKYFIKRITNIKVKRSKNERTNFRLSSDNL